MPPKSILATIVLWVAMAAAAVAQMPRAIITGPKDAKCGALVVLDATASEGIGRLWILAAAPDLDGTSFLATDSNLKCVFASPLPGRYEFVLVLSGVNANGGPAADVARHTVNLTTHTPPEPPRPKPPDPPIQENPYPVPTADLRPAAGTVAVVRTSRADATALASLYDGARRLVETASAARAAGVKPEIGTTADLRAWLINHGQPLGLSGRYPGLAGVVDAYLAKTLGTEIRDLTDVDARALHGLAWAIWEGGQ